MTLKLNQHTSCASIQGLFSAYLDGAVSGRRMQAIASHLETCVACNHVYTYTQVIPRQERSSSSSSSSFSSSSSGGSSSGQGSSGSW